MLPCLDSLEFSSKTTVRSILLQNPARGAKGRVTLADYNHPSPTFSVETTGHLIDYPLRSGT